MKTSIRGQKGDTMKKSILIAGIAVILIGVICLQYIGLEEKNKSPDR